LNIDDADALDFLRTDAVAKRIFQVRVGKPLRAEIDDDQRLVELRFVDANGDLVTIARDGQRFKATAIAAPTAVEWKMAHGEIRTSLQDAADGADLPDAITRQLVDIFAGDIDVYHDLKAGDRFAVVFEPHYRDGEEVGAGRLIAAEFENRGKTFRAFLSRDANGAEEYYAEDGAPRRAAFLRSPVEFSRITSGFTDARFHPILHTWRAHK